MRSKYIAAAGVILIFLAVSCERDIPVINDGRYVEPVFTASAIPDKIQFGIDKVYHYRIRFDTDYMKNEGFFVSANFTYDDHIVEMDLYDDGVTDDSLRSDVVASNNVWSGGINSYDFPDEGDWSLNIIANLNERVLDEFVYDTYIRVKMNTPPSITAITGILEKDTLHSGFPTFEITVSVDDPDNDSEGINDDQKLDLKIFSGTNSKTFSYKRESPMSDFVIQADSTYASRLKGHYSFEFTATDMYEETDVVVIEDIYIENTAPSLYNLQYPDTVYLPHTGENPVVFRIEVNVNDPQGHLEHQDIDAVFMIIPSLGYTGVMRDNGSLSSGDRFKNDGVYTISFQVGHTNNEAVYPFEILARDKVNNLSPVIEGVLIFFRGDEKKVNRSVNEKNFNYPDPFDSSR